MPKTKLITVDGFTLDERFRVSLEWCGHEKPLYVARFCDDEVLGWYNTKNEAEIACLVYRRSQVKSLNFTM
tara:strand:- start:183 stop:395 length:213 start_codon:yes stop_codon:yes gene_type:complete